MRQQKVGGAGTGMRLTLSDLTLTA